MLPPPSGNAAPPPFPPPRSRASMGMPLERTLEAMRRGSGRPLSAPTGSPVHTGSLLPPTGPRNARMGAPKSTWGQWRMNNRGSRSTLPPPTAAGPMHGPLRPPTAAGPMHGPLRPPTAAGPMHGPLRPPSGQRMVGPLSPPTGKRMMGPPMGPAANMPPPKPIQSAAKAGPRMKPKTAIGLGIAGAAAIGVVMNRRGQGSSSGRQSAYRY
jgi:hypothetical protein